MSSVIVWVVTGDLRAYVWVQFASLLTIPMMMVLYRSGYTHGWLLLAAFVGYALAKLAEHYDVALFTLSGETVSGHTLKHLLAAGGCYCIALMLARRRRVPDWPYPADQPSI